MRVHLYLTEPVAWRLGGSFSLPHIHLSRALGACLSQTARRLLLGAPSWAGVGCGSKGGHQGIVNCPPRYTILPPLQTVQAMLQWTCASGRVSLLKAASQELDGALSKIALRSTSKLKWHLPET